MGPSTPEAMRKALHVSETLAYRFTLLSVGDAQLELRVAEEKTAELPWGESLITTGRGWIKGFTETLKRHISTLGTRGYFQRHEIGCPDVGKTISGVCEVPIQLRIRLHDC
jgi:hypothetical protein